MKAIALCAVCLFAVVSALPTDKSEKQQRFINLWTAGEKTNCFKHLNELQEGEHSYNCVWPRVNSFCFFFSFWKDNGELCLEGIQCKSGCCFRRNGLDLARCASLSAENQECSPNYIFDVYYKCPCEKGLKCETDRSIIGSILHTEYGICLDPKAPPTTNSV
ncbi:uncharacterized protein LOC102346221 [Latimeria chalumnae]|uniref:uncharacterized protein LOC102346221 n=1 Tax=Latimeria chalumnae TaxID=7897 RepID=UPI00313BEFF3